MGSPPLLSHVNYAALRFTLRNGLVGCLLDHVGEVLRDLLLCVVDIPQSVDEQIVERLDVFGKKAHGFPP